MTNRQYRIVVAKTRPGLSVAAKPDWTILESTVREFARLETNDDQSLGNIGEVLVEQPGFVALAFRDA